MFVGEDDVGFTRNDWFPAIKDGECIYRDVQPSSCAARARDRLEPLCFCPQLSYTPTRSMTFGASPSWTVTQSPSGTATKTPRETRSPASTPPPSQTALPIPLVFPPFDFTAVYEAPCAFQMFIVPPGVYNLTVVAWGAGGMKFYDVSSYMQYPGGAGAGAFVAGVAPVTPGETLRVTVGGWGAREACGWSGESEEFGAGGGFSAVSRIHPATGVWVYLALAGGGAGPCDGCQYQPGQAVPVGSCGTIPPGPTSCYRGAGGGWRTVDDGVGVCEGGTSCASGLVPASVRSFSGLRGGVPAQMGLPFYGGAAGQASRPGRVVLAWHTPPTPTRTRTATRSATRSRSAPPSAPPLCPAPVGRVVALRGVGGSAPPADAAGALGSPALYTSGSCAAGFKTFLPGPRLVFLIDLGEDAPLGGVLTVTTCGHSADNTVLYVGTGCPVWAAPFGCLRGNDNAGDDGGVGACAANPRAAALALPAVASRVYFVQVAGYGGSPVVSGLGWSYAPPATRTASRTRSRSRAAGSRAQSSSRSGSRSRTRKPKLR